MEKAQTAAQSSLGRLTYTDLAQTDAFFAPFAPDSIRPTFSPQIARMSAELAANAYALDINPWARAGWTDCTFVIEDKIVTLDRDSDSKLAAIEHEWKRYRAKSLLHGVRPIGDLMRAARQFLVTDMAKTIVMTRILPDGQAVVALSFIGTTQKYYDWFTNFKFQPRSGMHHGFLELARQFDLQTARVSLPALAAALGETSCTLADVVRMAAQPDSGIRLWLSGHSQGGALVQTYTHLLLDKGVAPEHIHGYSYAAPTVCICGGVADPAAYPIYNLINADDLVPRIGAQLRLGMDMVYTPNEAFIAGHYHIDEEVLPAYGRVAYIADQVQSTRDALQWGIAVMRMMSTAETDDGLEALFSDIVPYLSFLRRMGLSLDEMGQFMGSKLTEHYRTLTGEEPEPALLARYEEMMRDALREFGGKAISRALATRLTAPHRISPDKRDDAFIPAYIAIARRYLPQMEAGVWLADAPPRCLDGHGNVILPRARRLSMLPDPGEIQLLEAPKTQDFPALENNGYKT